METRLLAPQPLAGYRILVLEDEYLIAMDVEQLCRDHGAKEAILLHDLDTIQSRIENISFDVAVIDVMLGGNSTLEFAQSLRQRNLPFVFATGYADASERFADFPGVPVVGKPYGGPELVEAIAQAVRQKEPSSDI